MQDKQRQTSKQSSAASRNFDSLPDAAHVRLPAVKELFGCSRATVWNWVKDGKIPAPRKLSTRVTVWNVGDLRRALGN